VRCRIRFELALEELRRKFPTVSLPATLQCAGNRRQELVAVRFIPGEVVWSTQAIGTALWSGVRLRDVLLAAGIDGTADGTRHAAFEGYDRSTPEDQPLPYQVSISLQKALNPEVLLAFEMNGQPVPAAHGFPLRVVVPGYIGARSVKWVRRIIARDTPSDGHFQRRAYRLFPPDVRAETVDWEKGLMLGEMNVNAAICHPQDGSVIPAGPIEVKGYAIAGGGRLIAQVDVSIDGGKTWSTADLLGEPHSWTWRLWRVGLRLAAGKHTIVVRAVDTAADTPGITGKRLEFQRLYEQCMAQGPCRGGIRPVILPFTIGCACPAPGAKLSWCLSAS